MEKGIITTDVCIIHIMFNEILKLNKNFNLSLIKKTTKKFLSLL